MFRFSRHPGSKTPRSQRKQLETLVFSIWERGWRGVLCRVNPDPASG